MKTRKFILALVALFAFASIQPAIAQKQTKKELEKQLHAKADRTARKEAKRLKKDEGWQVFAGALPLEKMLEKSYLMQYETDEEGHPKYIMATGNGVGGSRTAAKLAAIETAKNELAGLIETRMAQLISTNIANLQLSTVDAESETKILASAKNMVAVTLSGVQPIVVIYRDRSSVSRARKIKNADKLKKGKVEVQVTLFYNEENAEKVAKKAIKQTLKEDLKNNEEDLKKLMDL